MWVGWTFAAAVAAEPQWRRLYSEQAAATSFLESAWNRYTENYHPNYALDGDPATAWVEGVDGDGVGQVLSWDVSALSSARAVKVRIRNGYQKSAALLTANGAPREVTLTAWRGRTVVAEKTVALERAEGWQEVVLDTGGQGLNHLELRVASVTPGSRYKDTCVSDVETWVDSDVPYNEAYERAKLARLQRWTAERLETARWFASQPKAWPFADAAFRVSSSAPLDEAAFEAAAAPLRAAAARVSAGTPWHAAAARAGATERVPDGLEELAPLARFLRASELGLFEAPDAGRKAVVEGAEEEGDWSLERWTENLRLERVDGAPRWATTRFGTVEEGRMTTTTVTEALLGWDEAGRLVAARLVTRTQDGEGFDRDRELLLSLSWSAEGKVERVESRERIAASGFGQTRVERLHEVRVP